MQVNAVVGKMSSLITQQQIDEVAFFDGKVNIAIGIIATLLLGYGQTAEEILLHTLGETVAVHDSGVAVWKNKLQNSRIRPTSVIQALFPERRFTINNNISIPGKYFQALVRTMPHSEYPSGSSCVCQVIDEYLTDLWPHLSLTAQGIPASFDTASTPFLLPSALLARMARIYPRVRYGAPNTAKKLGRVFSPFSFVYLPIKWLPTDRCSAIRREVPAGGRPNVSWCLLKMDRWRAREPSSAPPPRYTHCNTRCYSSNAFTTFIPPIFV